MGAQVEALSPKLGAFLDDNAFHFDDFSRGGGSSHDKGKPANDNPIGRFRSSSQAFAAFLEFENQAEQGRGAVQGNYYNRGTIARVITIYETNARVIKGEIIPLGNMLTMML